MISNWPCPLPGGGTVAEMAVLFDRERTMRLLLIPALFDEANKLRRLAVEVMRRLDGAGIDSFLPDLPGWNESLLPFEEQTLDSWQAAARKAATHFRATHVLALRAGAVLAPAQLPGWDYAPIGGANALRALLRSRLVSAREAGHEESMDSLMEAGRSETIELAGYRIGAPLFRALEASRLADGHGRRLIDQDTVGGGGLWLRSEPDFDADQADALAAIVALARSA